MPIVAKDSGANFIPCPPGLQQAVCCDVVDLGKLPNPYKNGRPENKVRIVWQTENARDDGKPHIVSMTATLSLHEKAKLRKILEAWRNRKFTEEELKGFDLENLLGANCQLQVVHSDKGDGRVFANIQSLVPLGKGMARMSITDYTRTVDRDGYVPPDTADDDVDQPGAAVEPF